MGKTTGFLEFERQDETYQAPKERTDPILRCEKAIRLNSKLFSDPAYCNKSWQDNLNILHDNSKWARDHLYNQILKNCEQQFKEVA